MNSYSKEEIQQVNSAARRLKLLETRLQKEHNGVRLSWKLFAGSINRINQIAVPNAYTNDTMHREIQKTILRIGVIRDMEYCEYSNTYIFYWVFV